MAPNRRKETPEKSEEQPPRSTSSGLLNRADGTNFRRNEGHQRPGLLCSMRNRFHVPSQWHIPSMSFVNRTTDSLAASVTSPTSDPSSRFKRLSSSLRGRTPDGPVHPPFEATRKVTYTVRGSLSRPSAEVPRDSRRSISGPSALSAKDKPDASPTQLGELSCSSPPRLEANTGLDFRQSLIGVSWPCESILFCELSCSKFVGCNSHPWLGTNSR